MGVPRHSKCVSAAAAAAAAIHFGRLWFAAAARRRLWLEADIHPTAAAEAEGLGAADAAAAAAYGAAQHKRGIMQRTAAPTATRFCYEAMPCCYSFL